MGQIVYLTCVTAITTLFTVHIAAADLRQPSQQQIQKLNYLNAFPKLNFGKSLNTLRLLKRVDNDNDCRRDNKIPSSEEILPDTIHKHTYDEMYKGENGRAGRNNLIGNPKVIPYLNTEDLPLYVLGRVSQEYDYY